MQGASKLNMNPAKPEQPASGLKRQVVYMPSCVTRMMGPALSDPERSSVPEKMLSSFEKAAPLGSTLRRLARISRIRNFFADMTFYQDTQHI